MAASFICRRYVLNDNDLSDAFDLLDMDKDGALSRAEVAALLRTIKVDPDRAELNFVFDEIDSEKSGKIRKSDFLEYMKCPLIHQITVGQLEEEFRQHDTDRDGAINVDQLGDILAATAGITDKRVVGHVFERTDDDRDGLITYEQFLDLMRS